MLSNSDPNAISHAVRHLTDLGVGPRHAEQVVDSCAVTFERSNGLRRLVLVTDWVVDPTALVDAPAAVTR